VGREGFRTVRPQRYDFLGNTPTKNVHKKNNRNKLPFLTSQIPHQGHEITTKQNRTKRPTPTTPNIGVTHTCPIGVSHTPTTGVTHSD